MGKVKSKKEEREADSVYRVSKMVNQDVIGGENCALSTANLKKQSQFAMWPNERNHF